MRRIAMIVLSHYPADPRVRREAEELNRSGFAVDVICLRGTTETAVESFDHVTAYRIMPGTEKKESVLKYFRLSLLFAIKAFARLLRLSWQRQYSVIQVHNMPDYLMFVGVVHKILGRPLILDLHDLTPELFASKWGAGKNAVFGPLVRLAEKSACRLADHLITTSSGFRNRLIARGVSPDKITLVLNAADRHIFKARSPRQWPLITHGARLLYHGTVAKRFGLHLAIAAVHELQTRMPGTQLHIYGKYDPTYRAELEEMIARLKLENQVILNGFLRQEDIVEVIENSDLGVVPYLSDPFMDLALSTKTFEYVGMGLPVVASRLPSLTALFDETSLHYFAPGAAADLANKIAALCGNPQARKEYADRAAVTYEKFSWPIMAERYLALIKRLNGGNGQWTQ